MTADPNLAPVSPDPTLRAMLESLRLAPALPVPPDRRDLFAAAALCGLLASNPTLAPLDRGAPLIPRVAARAAAWADALDAALAEGGA